jgi:chemotaxis protein MotB
MRNKEPEKHPNHERWVISYADFTTLLLATFVVMYAVSSINSSKFQEMAEAFSTAFIGRQVTIQASGFSAANKAPFDFMPSPVHVPIVTRQKQIKDLPPALKQDDVSADPDEVDGKIDPFAKETDMKNIPKPPPIVVQTPRSDVTPSEEPKAPPVQADKIKRAPLDKAYEELKKALVQLIGKGQVRVSLQSLGIVIDINEVLLFRSGKAHLTPQALPLIDDIAKVLHGLPYQIQVNGFTDDTPIHNREFDSNWDLSATRSIAVVKRFAAAGLDPALLVGAGFGQYHPVAPNTSAEGKTMNRRVSIVVVSSVQGEDPLRTPLLGSPVPQRGAATPGAAPAASVVVAPTSEAGAAPAASSVP